MKDTIQRHKRKLGIAALVLACTPLLMAGACGPTAEETARNQVQAQKQQGETLEKKNLELKRQREENPDATRFLYLLTPMGQPLGYYVTKGKISSSASQRTPEQDNMWTCGGSSGNYGCSAIVVDGPKDDGSYGSGDPGIFFFLADGTMVETSVDYVLSDKPINLPGVPQLG